MTFDNVGKVITPKYETTDQSAKYKIWANAFATINRIEPETPLNSDMRQTTPATQIPLQQILPNQETINTVTKSMGQVCATLLGRGTFPGLKCTPREHHKYSSESARKSEFVSATQLRLFMTLKWLFFPVDFCHKIKQSSHQSNEEVKQLMPLTLRSTTRIHYI